MNIFNHLLLLKSPHPYLLSAFGECWCYCYVYVLHLPYIPEHASALEHCLFLFFFFNKDPLHETSVQGWCTGKTQRDGMEREARGGIGMGNTCKFVADSCQCMAKTTTIL